MFDGQRCLTTALSTLAATLVFFVIIIIIIISLTASSDCFKSQKIGACQSSPGLLCANAA